jgi:hypothetical protein
VFLSYRRDDSAPRAGRLRDALAARFGQDNIFQDVVTVVPGERFDNAIETALGRCDATIAVIGPGWVSAVDANGRLRLDDANDYVRRELTIALTRDAPTFPVLVGGATMPTADQLPPEMRTLALRQAISIRDESWLEDVDRLVDAMGGAPNRSRGWGLAAGVAAVAVFAVAGAVWLGSRGHDDNSASATTSIAAVPFDATTAHPPDCADPNETEWKALGLHGESKPSAWQFTVLDVYDLDADSDDTNVIVRVDATDMAPSSLIHYPFYALVVDGKRLVPSCFRIVTGRNSVDPGHVSEALVGFIGPQTVPATVSLAIDDSGTNYSVAAKK